MALLISEIKTLWLTLDISIVNEKNIFPVINAIFVTFTKTATDFLNIEKKSGLKFSG